MATLHGDFVWYELMTPDPDGAAAFYGAVLGWSCTASDGSGAEGYREWRTPYGQVGGLLPLTGAMQEGGARPCWIGYVHVDDIDAQCPRLVEGGATILMGPQDIPGVGRFVMILDPQGTPLYVMTDSSGQASNAFAKESPLPGHCSWNELATADPAGAWAFYGSQFGWQRDGALDLGEAGQYEFIRSDMVIGAIMPKMPEMPASMWTFYFRVPDIDAAAQGAVDNGGRILVPPMEIPGGEFSGTIADPQGAVFGLVGARR